MSLYSKIKGGDPQEIVKALTRQEDVESNDFSAFASLSDTKDIALPYIDSWRTIGNGIVSFGLNNDFMKLLDTLYHASVLNGSILEFKELCLIGGGYTWEGIDKLTISEKIELYSFLVDFFDDFLEGTTYNLVVHERTYAMIEVKKSADGNKTKKIKLMKAGKVLKTVDGKFAVCDDWSRSSRVDYYEKYSAKCGEGKYIIEEAKLKSNDYYAIPTYASANNWASLEYESSVLHKANIQEGIFPSYILKFPKKANPKEMVKIRDTVESMKGARNSSKIAVFFANNKEQMPELDAVPQVQTDKIFLQTDERIDSKICQAHKIDPMIMGIRVSGKLGSGTELEKSIAIFERINIVPKRRQIEKFVNEILEIKGFYKVKIKINQFDIIEYINKIE